MSLNRCFLACAEQPLPEIYRLSPRQHDDVGKQTKQTMLLIRRVA